MGHLRHLKFLKLTHLSKVEYVVSSKINGDGDAATSADADLVLFPSLEKLGLWSMPKLKGWWKSKSESESNSYSYSLHQLSHLTIYDCCNLTTFPRCPELKEFKLNGVQRQPPFLPLLPWNYIMPETEDTGYSNSEVKERCLMPTGSNWITYDANFLVICTLDLSS